MASSSRICNILNRQPQQPKLLKKNFFFFEIMRTIISYVLYVRFVATFMQPPFFDVHKYASLGHKHVFRNFEFKSKNVLLKQLHTQMIVRKVQEDKNDLHHGLKIRTNCLDRRKFFPLILSPAIYSLQPPISHASALESDSEKSSIQQDYDKYSS